MLSQKPIDILCPSCASQRVWKDGLRYPRSHSKPVQRYVCRECGYRFSESTWKNCSNGIKHSEPNQKIHSKILCSLSTLPYDRQVCVTEAEGTKNLAEVESRTEKRAAGATKPDQTTIKSKILEYAWWMKKNGYAESTITGRIKLLRILLKRGANLLDPESVKDAIARQEKWSDGRKANAVEAYTLFLTMLGGKWDPPQYKRIRKLPFIPMEKEIDQLIAGCRGINAALLQLLKETGVRIGEAWKIKWVDLDPLNNTIRITPEKGSDPRMFKISNKLMAMLNATPRKAPTIFGSASMRTRRRIFEYQRKRISDMLKNPRLLNISFHTLRHFKATMEYHKTRDILYVMKVLGHKNINNTLIYTHLVEFQDDEYVTRVAKTIDEDRELIEAGYEYITERDGIKIYRKRK